MGQKHFSFIVENHCSDRYTDIINPAFHHPHYTKAPDLLVRDLFFQFYV